MKKSNNLVSPIELLEREKREREKKNHTRLTIHLSSLFPASLADYRDSKQNNNTKTRLARTSNECSEMLQTKKKPKEEGKTDKPKVRQQTTSMQVKNTNVE